MNNPFSARSASLSGPGTDYLPITPNDATDLPEIAIALYVETGGSVRFHSVRGGVRTVKVSDNGWILCGLSRVLATGTTAQGLHGVIIG